MVRVRKVSVCWKTSSSIIELLLRITLDEFVTVTLNCLNMNPSSYLSAFVNNENCSTIVSLT